MYNDQDTQFSNSTIMIKIHYSTRRQCYIYVIFLISIMLSSYFNKDHLLNVEYIAFICICFEFYLGCNHIEVYGIRYTLIRLALCHRRLALCHQVMQRGKGGVLMVQRILCTVYFYVITALLYLYTPWIGKKNIKKKYLGTL